ncbi:TonB-dependent receptor [candidate division KSB1 bacterium]|nr:TonB-dependent receptor [candidate division KSB1 bacterium]
MVKRILICLLLVTIIQGWLIAGTTGKIAGVAKDRQTGEALIGVNIIIEGTKMGAATDVDGEYYILNIPPGSYTLKASMIGYKNFSMTQVRVAPDLTTRIEFLLEGEVIAGETVTIVAERPLIQKDVTFSGTTTTAEEIQNMPVNSFSEAAMLASGFIVTGKGSADGSEEIHIRGGRANEIGYMIDGFYVKEPHGGGISADGLGSDVPSQGIQDLSIITGTFNAEYGEAMSGIVSIVTKEGAPDYGGMLRFSTDQFGVAKYDNNTNRVEGSFSGPLPLLSKYGNFFISADNLNTDTYLHESKSNVHDKNGNPITRVHHPLTFDQRERYTAKLSLRPFTNLKMVMGYNRYFEKQRLYNALFKEIPEHNGLDYQTSELFHFTMTHTLNLKTYYNLKAGWFKYSYLHELTSAFLSINKPVLVGDAFDGTSNYEFYGDYLDHVEYDTIRVTADSIYIKPDSIFVTSDDDFWQNYTTRELSFMGDLTSQIHKNHLVKLGFEYKSYRVQEDRLVNINYNGPGKSDEETHFNFKPVKFSAYLQDKMEFKQFIINAGVRLDYLDPKASYLASFTKPDPKDMIEAKPKYRLSPRIGFGHPLTDKIRLHFAYGHFYQFPEFNLLYRRTNMNDPAGLLNTATGYRPRIGNPNLKPQTTIAYEFGTEMALSDDIVADLTIFYKDIHDYISTRFFDVNPKPYVAIVNLDYAHSRGIEFSLKKRFSNHYSATINYTYSRAEGNADDWDTHFMEYQNASVTGQIPPKKTVTLEWDQPHTFNAQLDIRWPNNWGVNILASLGNGLPYTPTDARGKHIGEVNSARMPWTGTVDMRLNKDFHFYGFKQRFFANVWNLFDKKNVLNVFTSSGKPDYSTNPNASEEAMHNPDWYGPPRTVEFGMQIDF